MDIKDIHQIFLQCHSVSIDTRKITPGCLFVAIRGERFDANTFANEALSLGASYVLIDDKNYFVDERTIVVQNTLEVLQDLARFHRQFLKLPIIAITGSNGKTTSKELIQVVLSKKYQTIATIGNLNNHIGVPLTLLSFNSATEIGIVEMGANHQKEIEFLCNIAHPDFGYITNFGKAHLEGFGGVEGVITGKSEMYNFLIGHSKKAFVNLDDAIQVEKTASMERITFGVLQKEATTCIDKITADPLVTVCVGDTVIKSRLIGLYNATNISVAVAVGQYFHVEDEAIKEAIENYTPENNRSQLVSINSNEIILDAYNANPSSMSVAIANFLQIDKTGKIVILGDMFELGNQSIEEHKAIIDLLSKEENIECYFIGNDFFQSRIDRRQFHFYESFESFSLVLTQLAFKGKLILIKGSRGMALERTLQFL